MAKKIIPPLKKLEDSDIMEYGAHKGKHLIDIPDSFFHYIWDEPWFQASTLPFYLRLWVYIKENFNKQ